MENGTRYGLLDARNPSGIDAKCGDHFPQDFSLPIACPDLDYFRFADNSVLFVGATNLIPPVSTSSLAAGRHNRKNQLDRSIKVEVKKKHISCGWNFSCFAAHLMERDLF